MRITVISTTHTMLDSSPTEQVNPKTNKINWRDVQRKKTRRKNIELRLLVKIWI